LSKGGEIVPERGKICPYRGKESIPKVEKKFPENFFLQSERISSKWKSFPQKLRLKIVFPKVKEFFPKN
jgi:hypothetical protein